MTVRPWLAVAGGLLGLGLLTWSPWLVALGTLVLGTGLVARGWTAVALRGVTYERRLSQPRAFPGDKLALEIDVRNGKLAPLAWLRVQDTLPARLRIRGGRIAASGRPGAVSLTHVTSLLPYERVRFRYEVSGPRGYYILGPAEVESGDPFGLYDIRGAVEGTARLVIYPRILGLRDLGFPRGQPFAAHPDRRALLRDPQLPVGVRPYAPHDALRHIHWKASARTGDLRTKVLEPVSRATAVLVVNAATFESVWIGVRANEQEAVLEVAASLAAAGLKEGLAVGLTANSAAPGRGRTARVAPGSRRGQLRELLEALAGVSSFITMPVERLVAVESRRAPWGATLVVVTPVVTDGLLAELERLRRAGRPVALVVVGRDVTVPPARHPVHVVAPPEPVAA